MYRSRVLLAGVCSLLAAAAPVLADLVVGDKAPALRVATWVKGDPIDLAKAAPDEVHVVEFWATWCGPCRRSIPHLSELQDQFKGKQVTMIGVSNETSEVVEKFLKAGWDEKMRYHVAIDDDKAMTEAWMKAAGQKGIPAAFIVKGGVIKWIGHPMDEEFGAMIAGLCGDEKYAERAEKLTSLMSRMGRAETDEDWREVVAVCGELLEIKPNDEQLAMHKFQVLATKLKEKERAVEWGMEIVRTTDDAGTLNDFSWMILTDPRYQGMRLVDLAKAGAEKAVKLSNERDPAILDTYARALADSGDIEGAMDWQQKAVDLCESRDLKRELKRTLRDYKRRLER